MTSVERSLGRDTDCSETGNVKRYIRSAWSEVGATTVYGIAVCRVAVGVGLVSDEQM